MIDSSRRTLSACLRRARHFTRLTAAIVCASTVIMPSHSVFADLLVDPTGGTSLINLADDQTSNGRALGFTFNFFGSPVTTIDASSNGNLNFAGNSSTGSSPFPTASISDSAIAAYWTDLIVERAPLVENVNAGISYSVTWQDVSHFSDRNLSHTFQVTLFGAAQTLGGYSFLADDIVFSYQALAPLPNGYDATVGLNQGDGVRYAVLPGTLDGKILDSSLIPMSTGDFIIFRPDGLGGYTAINTATPRHSAVESGLPFANAIGQSVMGSVQGTLADINGHLFSLRAGNGDDENDNDGVSATLDYGVTLGQGDGPEGKAPRRAAPAASREWQVFTTVNFANVRLGTIGTQPGANSYTWAPGVGVEKRVAPSLTLGFAANLLESHQSYGGGLGTLEMEGVALSTYASYVKRDYWIDLLYGFGRFDLSTDRNPGFAFPMAQGETSAYTNAVQLNGGWKFHVPAWKLVHGPFAGVDYLNVKVEDYNERSGGAAALSYAGRSIDSLITRVGYSVSRDFDTNFAKITPQFRLSYERQNINNNNGTSVNLINQPFSATSNSQSPGQSYMVAGAGVNFEFNPYFNMMLSYQGQFLRQDMQVHYASVRFGYKF